VHYVGCYTVIDDHVYWRSVDLILDSLSSELVGGPYLTLQVKAPFLWNVGNIIIRQVVTSLTARNFGSATVRMSHLVAWKENGVAGFYMFLSVHTPVQGQSILRSQNLEFVSFKVSNFPLYFSLPHIPSLFGRAATKHRWRFEALRPLVPKVALRNSEPSSCCN
jgi:hypothetical protein